MMHHRSQSALAQEPRLLPGFEHIRRSWDRTQGLYTASILPGEYYVTEQDEMITTVLGSCVSACIRDPQAGIGGRNHFMLPINQSDTQAATQSNTGDAARYGNQAMELLINTILKHSGRRANFQVKIFGGGRILSQMTDVGRRNIAFVQAYIQLEGLRLVAEDVGDVHPRKVLYFPMSGKERVKKLRALHNATVVQQETQYLGRLNRPIAGDIELF